MDTIFIFAANYLFLIQAVILGAYFLMRRWPAQKPMAVFAVPAGLLAGALGFLGNQLYYDPRPFVVGHFTPLIQHVADNGFPSDHTLLVSAMAAVGMYWNKWLGVVLWIIAATVAYSRVYVGLHHPLDVMASMVFALIGVSAWRVALNCVWKNYSGPYKP